MNAYYVYQSWGQVLVTYTKKKETEKDLIQPHLVIQKGPRLYANN